MENIDSSPKNSEPYARSRNAKTFALEPTIAHHCRAITFSGVDGLPPKIASDSRIEVGVPASTAAQGPVAEINRSAKDQRTAGESHPPQDLMQNRDAEDRSDQRFQANEDSCLRFGNPLQSPVPQHGCGRRCQ